MKRIIALLLIAQPFSGWTQIGIESNFNGMHTGWNQDFSLTYRINSLRLSIGPKYHYNFESAFPRPQADFYKKAFWARSFSEHIGLNFCADYTFLDREHFSLYTNYNFQLTRSHIRHENYYALYPLVPNPQSESDYAYEYHKNFIGPVWGFENNIGLGCRFHFSDRFYMNQKIGVGVLFYKNTDQNNIIISSKGWEASTMYSFGLGWIINP